MARKTVVVGLLGEVLDAGNQKKRWNRWRPTVAVCQQDDLLIDRFELLYEPKQQALLEQVIADLRQVSPETEVVPHPIEFRDAWDFEDVYSGLVAAIDRLQPNPDQDDYLVHITTGTHVAQICLFLLTESYRLPGKLLQTSPDRGAPEGVYRVIDLDLSHYDRIAARFERETRDDVSFLKAGIATRNEQFNQLIDQVERVAAASAAPILLTGPTGAGKTQLARRIYELKRRRAGLRGEFVEANCATLRGDQALSMLFGHVKGAFTGAAGNRDGLLRRAEDGVLFLDEIGELGLEEQAMLLRAVEEGVFLPVGADHEARSRFQLVAGTNRDLRRDVAAGKFREDLLARIDLWTFRLPALRDRREDLEPNVEYELGRWREATGKQIRFQPSALRAFLEFARSPDALWRGNFRDLNAAITRMSTLAPQGRITAGCVRDEIDRLQTQWRGASTDENETLLRDCLDDASLEALDRFDRVQLADVIRVCRRSESLSAAGRTLFDKSRTRRQSTNDADRLRKYLQRFGLDWKSLQRPSIVGKSEDPA